VPPVGGASPEAGEAIGLTDSADSVVGRMWQALREVNDPEIPISLVDLGLIYDLRFRDGTAEVDLTYTATGCPCTHFIKWDVAERLQREPDVLDVRITEVWDPPWTKGRVSAAGRRRLKELGVSV
jgi:metal-sulfur cluster biosynthetic enzyme